MRVGEIDQDKHNISRLLSILHKILPNDHIWDLKYFYNLQGKANTDIMQNILDIAISSDTIVFDGFLKWFSIVSQSAGFSPAQEAIRLIFDYQKVKSKLEEARGSVGEGAFLLLAKSKIIPSGELRQILDLSKEDYYKGLDWSTMFKRLIQDLNQEGQLSLLEEILSHLTDYPESIKYAALSEYSSLSRNISIDLQEKDLGLPFRDTI